ncbi:replication protein [Sporosarcina sp. FSL K6-1522]|uniref:replication protein n=1 Tax=Sporosarcina sp. FSL K6-1522 TaxID=2921554 RepID=UPI00315AEA28
MADVQLEHGFTKIANELLDAIQSFQFTQNQFKLLLALWRNTYGWNRKQCEFSLNQIIRQTGLQRKRVIETLKSLEENKVIIEVKAPVGTSPKIVEFNKNYATWTIKKYAGMEISSGHGDTSRVGQNDTPSTWNYESSSGRNDTSREDLGVVMPTPLAGETTPPSSGQSDTPPVVMPTPLSSGHGDTSRVGQDDTPINTKEILKTINIKTEVKKGAADFENPIVENLVKPKIQNANDESENYLRQLLNRFVELRAFGFDFKPADLNAAKEIQAAGVPLLEAISSLEEAFRNYNPRHSRDRIHSLSYCVGFILDRHFPAQTKSKKSTREEITPEWFAKDKQPERIIPTESNSEIERMRQELLRELGGEQTV